MTIGVFKSASPVNLLSPISTIFTIWWFNTASETYVGVLK
ncbi:hypothetical protein E2C01_096705 [Portunus trituberculatus]|uniref:Uncharacterized protein n=1 Tax=Portunus trituberculatus TaxID=210409 RepID=A0A5B7K3S5_PORTR|nr:hypothetical protein [Portunus trituberculatus]